MKPRYLYLYVSGSPTITIHCKNTNPNVVRSSMHAHMLLFLPTVASLVHSFFPKIIFLSTLACFQQAPNTDRWLVPSHLTFMHFIDIPGDHLEILLELYCLCLSLHSILLECVYCLDCNIFTDQHCLLCLGLCHICLGFLFL
jgi:hypothetical protein